MRRGNCVDTFGQRSARAFAAFFQSVEEVEEQRHIRRFDLKQHWHRKLHNDSRSQWIGKQVTQLFNDDNDEWRSRLENGSAGRIVGALIEAGA